MNMAKIKILNRIDYPRERPDSSTPTVSFSDNNGVVYLSKCTCALLDLQPGDSVELAQDADDPIRFGFRKTKSVYGFKTHQKRQGLCFSASKLVSTLLMLTGGIHNKVVELETEPADGIYWVKRTSIDNRTWARQS